MILKYILVFLASDWIKEPPPPCGLDYPESNEVHIWLARIRTAELRGSTIVEVFHTSASEDGRVKPCPVSPWTAVGG